MYVKFLAAFTLWVITSTVAACQTELSADVSAKLIDAIGRRGDTLVLVGFSHPGACIKCEIALNALIEEMTACSGFPRAHRSIYLVSVNRKGELRAVREHYDTSYELIADVGGKLRALIPVGQDTFVVAMRGTRAWIIRPNDPYCQWLNDAERGR